MARTKRVADNLLGVPRDELLDECRRAQEARARAARALDLAEAELTLAHTRLLAANCRPDESAADRVRALLTEHEGRVASRRGAIGEHAP